ncbi:MAG: protein YgfX [Methylococcales bacterium]
MLTKKYQPPLRLEISDSKRLNKLMILIHGLALLASIMNSLPIILKCVLLIAVSCHFYILHKQLKIKHYRIEHSEQGWILAEGDKLDAIRILPSTVISIFAIFLHVKIDDKPKQTLVIASDSLSDDDYRCLIVRLKTTLSIE